MLAVIETHPIQYHAPVYRVVRERFGIPVTAVYGSDFSVAGYLDREFDATFAWDTDLLSGYESRFLARVSQGGARSADEVSARGLAQVLREIAPGAVLLTGYSPRFHRVAFFHAWRTGRPLLFRGETTDHARRRSSTKGWVRDGGLRWLYRQCAKVLYVGHHSHTHYSRLNVPEARLAFSPYCVDTSAFQCDEVARANVRSATRENLGISESETLLLFSGKLSARKGPDLLLRAVKEIPAEIRQHIAVAFLGAGSMENELATLANSSPYVKVCFLGFQNQSGLSAYYHAADLLVLPSRHSETWGLVVNEALHHGVPCVVSEGVGCAPDLIDPGVTGEVCATDSISYLALAIQRAFRLTDRPDVRETCRNKVSRYSVEKAAEGIAAAYWAATGDKHE